MSFVYFFGITIINILTIAIFVRVIFSWFRPTGTNRFVKLVVDITDPVLTPVRRFMPKTGMFDFSPLVVILLLELVASLWEGIFRP